MATMSRDFGSMLDELIAAEEAARSAAAHVGGVDFLAAMDELQAKGIQIGDRTAAARYDEMAADRISEPVAARPVRAPLPSLDPADIGRELGIEALREVAALDAARRKFAFANHPDRVSPELRERAEQRMRVANMLVDQAKRNVR
jgi:hypothetical protein